MQSHPEARTKGRLLIVSPSFHGYWRPIEEAFSVLGYEVRTHRYDENATILAKLQVKLGSELPRRLGVADDAPVADARSRRARAAVHAFQPDRVLVVKGDVLTEPFWDALDRPRIPRTLWLYDELRRTRHTDETLDRFDALASYSRDDSAALQASGRNAAYVPLAFDTSIELHPRHVNEVTFIGARYPRRADLLQALHDAGVPVRAFGRDWSTDWFDRVRTWRLHSPDFASGRDLARDEAYGVMAGCPATLNIHGDQDGFTMRTFEAAGVGAVQLIDRTDVAEFYDPDTEVAVFTDEDELVDLARRSIADDRWGDQIRDAARRRTLAEHTFLQRARALASGWD
jgi:spore maturation protein CgeB